MKRVAGVITVPAEHMQDYISYHSAVWPEVLAALSRSNITNYSIFSFDQLLFSYFEYIGNAYEVDMAQLASDPLTEQWTLLQSSLQRPLSGRADGEWWAEMSEIFHTG